MKKQAVKKGIDSIISTKHKQKASKKGSIKGLNTSTKGLKNSEKRTTFVVNNQTLEHLLAYAWITRKPVKDVVQEAFLSFTSNKKIKPIIKRALNLQNEIK